ncbi:hypothetical protein [Bdellovibrio sp. NC01]|uniref:hypothetical protein n=1 Tax=Bdellovibrio sp. NC01 TaxID=2220073 RepID=UPI00115AEFC1|nr:hypothetical protein [Bdellovibrio sp. NC01]QDK36736.1 hypothetical protein DOE51_03530 [Bdellovibrio sp. NC01]
MNKAVITLLATLLTTSAGFAQTLKCVGSYETEQGGTDKVTLTVNLDDSANPFVKVKTSEYSKYFVSEDPITLKQNIDGSLTAIAGSGDRGELYLKLTIAGNEASALYSEDDSGWNYEIQSSDLQCK